MAQVKDEAKRVAIRDAAVLAVVEEGVGGASISRIAKRAQVSAGTIYLYYPSKEGMFCQIYLDIKTSFYQHIAAAIVPGDAPADNIRRLWFAMYDVARAKPRDFLFTEYVAVAQIIEADVLRRVGEMTAEAMKTLHQAQAEGVLKRVPMEAIHAVLVAPLMLLARQSALRAGPVDSAIVDATYNLIWSAIAIDK